MLNNLVDGQIEFYKAVCHFCPYCPPSTYPFLQAMEEWDRIIPVIQRIRVDV